ncbi:hypothetical protein H5410_062455 [Solanum commersonii]|uniref:Uncharacterized protein n=1 Tax=Solanum commersonii TaxID=4109 RepID=A0A9J5WAP7_SOLCO|nr:hypothetical protein H5410_062455 [Solanum commersonii]
MDFNYLIAEPKDEPGFQLAIKVTIFPNFGISIGFSNHHDACGNWFKEFNTVDIKRLFSVTGSPKFDLYTTDFGWGKPE